MTAADVAAIVIGELDPAEALWQIGAEHLSHTNHMLAIAAGIEDRCYAAAAAIWELARPGAVQGTLW